MKRKEKVILFRVILLLSAGIIAFSTTSKVQNDEILAYIVDTKKQDLQFYWKDDNGEVLKSIQNLKEFVERKNQLLTFATNGGMFKKDYSPQGLFIQKAQILSDLDTTEGVGNFYLKPNGVFCTTKDQTALICQTSDFNGIENVQFATQSGPMLLINGNINTAFKKGSTNLNIRNGVGILPDKRVVFAMSKSEINFYDFAQYFQRLGCKNALYLDGFVSKTYLPEKGWIQTEGNFGVMIGVTVKKNR